MAVGIALIAHAAKALSSAIIRAAVFARFTNPSPFLSAMAAKPLNFAAYRRGDINKIITCYFRMELSQMIQLFSSISNPGFPLVVDPDCQGAKLWLTKIRLANKLSLYVYSPFHPARPIALGPNVTSLIKENAITARALGLRADSHCRIRKLHKLPSKSPYCNTKEMIGCCRLLIWQVVADLCLENMPNS